MGEHIDARKNREHKSKRLREQHDGGSRRQRVSFKSYLRDLEEELLDDELDEAMSKKFSVTFEVEKKSDAAFDRRSAPEMKTVIVDAEDEAAAVKQIRKKFNPSGLIIVEPV